MSVCGYVCASCSGRSSQWVVWVGALWKDPCNCKFLHCSDALRSAGDALANLPWVDMICLSNGDNAYRAGKKS